MSGLRVVPYRLLRKLLEKNGFVWTRCVGSHNVFRRADGCTVVLPDHGSQVIVRSLIRKVLRDMGMTPAEYERELEKL